MKISIPSGRLLISDPCYIDRDKISEIMSGSKMGDDIHVLNVPTEATIKHVEKNGHIASISLIFSKEELPAGEIIGEQGVDTAQIFFADAEHFTKNWIEEEFQDKRIYRNKNDGRTLEYRKDFPHYAHPIESEGGLDMNTLNATGEWESVKIDYGKLNVSYNGLCHCHDDDPVDMLDEHIMVTETGAGDGCYDIEKFMTPDGNIARLTIVFIGKDEESEDYDDEDGIF